MHTLNKYLILLTLMTGCLYAANAQVKSKIKKGHRNKSESQFALEKGEVEADWEIGNENNNDQLGTFIYPNLAFRYGISDRLEVNTEINLVTAYSKSIQPKTRTSGIEPVSFGINYLLLKENNHRPSLIFSGQVALPWMTSPAFKASYYAPTLELLAQQQTGKKNVAGVSCGLFWDGFSTAGDFVYNVNDEYQFSKNWSVSLEFFGYLGKILPLNYSDIGLNYTFNKRIQIGCVAGLGLSTAAYTNYFGITGTWGFNIHSNSIR